MGSIEFIGIVDDSFHFQNTSIPNNANRFIGLFDNFNFLNWILFSLPIILIFVAIGVIKHSKYGILNKELRKKEKEYNIKKYNLDTNKKRVIFALKNFFKVFISFYIIAIILMIVHELLHAIIGFIFGGNMKIGIIPGGAVTITDTPMTKIQYLIMLLSPVILIGIIPSIILAIKYPSKTNTSFKTALISWFYMCMFLGMIFSASPDLISTYNVCNIIPNGAIMKQTNEGMIWYMPDEIIKSNL